MKEAFKAIGLVALGVTFLFFVWLMAVYRPFYQPCDTMAGWSTNVPYRCVAQ